MNKKILPNKAKILVATDNFWGRTIAACSSSEEPDRNYHYGPFFNNFELFEFGNLDQISKQIKNDSNIIAVFMEPI